MSQFSIDLSIRELDGTLILDLEDEANGYWVRAGGLPSEDVTWRRATAEPSPWMDGAVGTGLALDRQTVSVSVKVFGSTWPHVEQRVQQLIAAASTPQWLLSYGVEGVTKTWRAEAADVLLAPIEPIDIVNRRRFVLLTFPVQPSPAVTGLPE